MSLMHYRKPVIIIMIIESEFLFCPGKHLCGLLGLILFMALHQKSGAYSFCPFCLSACVSAKKL